MMFCSRHDAAFSLRPFHPQHPVSSATERSGQRRAAFRSLFLESLEPRLALAASLSPDYDALLTHGGGCACPICSGKGLEQLVAPQQAETVAAATTTTSTSTSLTVPQLSSNSAARVKLYLDFNGHYQGTWGSWSSVRTPAFDQDGNSSSFSSAELAAIREIWARVSEDYAPFQIDVTTIEPASFADRAAVRVAVGGNWSDWFGSSAGGVAYVGAFTSAAPNIAFVFAKALGGGNARYVAEAAAHEAGHLFGLSHQSTYAGSALTQPYNSGTSTLAPIMGVGYYASRSTWFNGPTDAGPTSYQNDVSILASSNNGFGLRPDDFGDSLSAASSLSVQSGTVNVKGIIEDYQDADVWKFTTGGGTVRLALNVAPFGANLDSILELKNASGQIVASSNSSVSLGSSLSATVAAGTYYVVARATGGYGSMGQYSLTGSVPASTTSSGTTTTSGGPEITVTVGGSQVADGGSVSFGTTDIGTPVTRTITITNHGTQALSLSRPGSVPAGYSIVSNLGVTSLPPGQATSLTIRLNATSAGTFAGRIVLANNDANEGQYDLNLSGTVRSATTTTTTTTTTSTSAIRILDNGQSGYAASGAWSTRTGSGRDSDLQSAARSSSGVTATARWNFSGLPAGSYRVWLTWQGNSVNASNAPVSFYDGSRLVRTVTVDQRTSASGLSADGSNWKLITTLTIGGSQLAVQLGNNASGTVIADAVRIERVASAAPLAGGSESPDEATDIWGAALLAETRLRSDVCESATDRDAADKGEINPQKHDEALVHLDFLEPVAGASGWNESPDLWTLVAQQGDEAPADEMDWRADEQPVWRI
jgi:HYDIN/CFA65/VesB family protein/reprolysin-like metallo-peptidase family M12B